MENRILLLLASLLLGINKSKSALQVFMQPHTSCISKIIGKNASRILVHRTKMMNNEERNNDEIRVDAEDSMGHKHLVTKEIDCFQYIDRSIRSILTKDPDESSNKLWNEAICAKDGCIMWDKLHCFVNECHGVETHDCKQVISMDYLIYIASKCEESLFQKEDRTHNSSLPITIQGLLALANNAAGLSNTSSIDNESNILIATMLSLNMLESSIRDLVQIKHGRAPLLKDMIEMIDSEANCNKRRIPLILAPVLRSLLLPNIGINLRNLVWHGFVSSIHRRWLALSIVLIISMDKLSGTSREKKSKGTSNDILLTIDKLREHDSLVHIFDSGRDIVNSEKEINSLKEDLMKSNFIPKSHSHLLNIYDKSTMRQYPLITVAITGLLIEHGLRLWWCDVNQVDEKMARPGTYYVTLDGNSQRDKHDLVLLPYLSNGANNQLVYELGGQVMALLADLFASHQGPNIRASVAHGLFNRLLYKEVKQIVSTSVEDNLSTADPIHDLVHAMLFTLRAIAYKKEKLEFPSSMQQFVSTYRPLFSYSATMVSGISHSMGSIDKLNQAIQSDDKIRNAIGMVSEAKRMQLANDLSALDSYRTQMNEFLSKLIMDSMDLDCNDVWSCRNTFRESENNTIASQCGSSILLLNEVAQGMEFFLNDLQNARIDCNQGSVSSRRRKQICRIFSMAGINLSFYKLCVLCALLHIESKFPKLDDTMGGSSSDRIIRVLSDDLLLHAVKRSRMVASTFSTSTNHDRAMKAVSDYLKGKSIKLIIQMQTVKHH